MGKLVDLDAARRRLRPADTAPLLDLLMRESRRRGSVLVIDEHSNVVGTCDNIVLSLVGDTRYTPNE